MGRSITPKYIVKVNHAGTVQSTDSAWNPRLESYDRAMANSELAQLPIYHASIPISEIDAILHRHNFKAMEEGIYCGRIGRVHEQVGIRTHLVMTWYKMEESGQYEIVAYLS
jgi:hypothetical protein